MALDRSSSASSGSLIRSFSHRLRRSFTRQRSQCGQQDCRQEENDAISNGCWKFRRSTRSSWVAIRQQAKDKEGSGITAAESSPLMPIELPDDVIELCLARASFETLLHARSVCKRWRDMTRSSYFLAARRAAAESRLWLLVFGLSKGGICMGQVQALPIDASTQQWHTLQAEPLAGRILFTTVAAGSVVFVVGGCSAHIPSGDSGGAASPKTHRSVLRFDVVAARWWKTSPMRAARSAPVAVTFAIEDRSRVVAISQGPVRRGGGAVPPRGVGTLDTTGLIVVGGHGQRNEALNTGEMYEAGSDTWYDIANWPAELGTLCAGAFAGRCFFGYSENDKLAAYDVELGCWRRIVASYVPDRPQDNLPRLVACDGAIFLVGVAWSTTGALQQHEARKMWKLVLQEDGSARWMEVSEHPDAPLDWNAVFLGHGKRIYGLEMFTMFGQMLDFVTLCDLGCSPRWIRVSRQGLAHDLDASSCLTKTAVLVQL